jgi:nitrogen regulatory protein PII-like uncharacterized protein
MERICKKCRGTGKITTDEAIANETINALKEFGISSFFFSKYCGLSPITISNIVKSKANPHPKTVKVIRDAIVKIRLEGVDVPKRGRKKKDVSQSEEETAIEQQPASREAVSESGTEPTRRVFYQAEDDDDWAEEVEAEDGE